MATEEQIAAVDKALGEPCLAEFSDDALRVRRNLLVVSLLTLIGALFNVKIAPDTPFFGFHLLNLSDQVVRTGMTITILYLLAHFAWYAFDSLAGWRVRVTGTRQTFITTGIFSNEDLDYTTEPRQSSLYNWWKAKRRVVLNLPGILSSIETSFAELKASLDDMKRSSQLADISGTVMNGVNELQRRMIELKSAIDEMQKLESSPRIEASLKRFDSWFKFWLRSQNLRWLVIDVSVPLMLGTIAIVVLLCPLSGIYSTSKPAEQHYQYRGIQLNSCHESVRPPLRYFATCNELDVL